MLEFSFLKIGKIFASVLLMAKNWLKNFTFKIFLQVPLGLILVLTHYNCYSKTLPAQLVLPYQKVNWQIDLGKNFGQRNCSVIKVFNAYLEGERAAQPFLRQLKTTCLFIYLAREVQQIELTFKGSLSQPLFKIIWLPEEKYQNWTIFQQAFVNCNMPGFIDLNSEGTKSSVSNVLSWHENNEGTRPFVLSSYSINCFEKKMENFDTKKSFKFDMSKRIGNELKTQLQKHLIQLDQQVNLGFVQLIIPIISPLNFKILISDCDVEKKKKLGDLLKDWWRWLPKEIVCAQDQLSISNELALAETNNEELNQSGIDLSALFNFDLNLAARGDLMGSNGLNFRSHFDVLGLNVPVVSPQKREKAFKLHQEVHFNQLCATESKSFLGDQRPYVSGGLYRKEVRFQDFGFEIELKTKCRALNKLQNTWKILLSSPHSAQEEINASANERRSFRLEQINSSGIWHEVTRFKGNWENSTQKGIPILKDLPLIGLLFSMSFRSNREKTLLLMVKQTIQKLSDWE